MTTKNPSSQKQFVQFISLTQELARFRLHLEAEADEPIQQMEVNAALFLSDLCQFLQLGAPQQQQILGEAATEYAQSISETLVRLPTVH